LAILGIQGLCDIIGYWYRNWLYAVVKTCKELLIEEEQSREYTAHNRALDFTDWA
jgi:hypothetical protein